MPSSYVIAASQSRHMSSRQRYIPLNTLERMNKVEFKIINALPEHAEVLQEWLYQPKNLEFNPIYKSNLEENRARLAELCSDFSQFGPGKKMYWIVLHQENPVGRLSIKNYNSESHSVEIGYQIDERLHGKGLGTIAVELLTHEVFTKTNIQSLIGLVAKLNTASRRVLEKCGFTMTEQTPDLINLQDIRRDLIKYVLQKN